MFRGVEGVRRGVRRVVWSVSDEHPEAMRLMDLNWQLGPLMQGLRRDVTRGPRAGGITPATSRAARGVAPTRMTARCTHGPAGS